MRMERGVLRAREEGQKSVEGRGTRVEAEGRKERCERIAGGSMPICIMRRRAPRRLRPSKQTYAFQSFSLLVLVLFLDPARTRTITRTRTNRIWDPFVARYGR